MDQFVEQQEKETRAQMDALMADYQDTIQKLHLTYKRKLNDLKVELETSECKAQQQYSVLMKRYEQLQSDKDALSQQLEGIETQRNHLEQELKVKRLLSTTYQDNTINDSDDDDTTSGQHVILDQQQQQQYGDQIILIRMGQQHKNELEELYNQFQQALEVKDRELETYAYHLNSLRMNHQKELETCRIGSDKRINYLTRQMEGYKMTIQGYINTLEEIQVQMGTLEQQQQRDHETILQLTQEKHVLLEENNRLCRPIPHPAID